MILDKALILKGLGGLTVLGGTATAAYFGITSLGGDSPESLIEKAGLKCTFNGDSCEITSLESGKKINVKNNTTKEEGKTFTISTPNTAKIKVQKNVTEGGYNQNLKLTIEGGDIDLTNGTTSGSNSISKLEQFETYEIKEEGDKWYLSRKTDALTGKSKALGLPDNCKLPSSETTTCSNITKDQLKEIKFDGKGNNEPSIANDGTPTITLTITKVDSSDSIFNTGGYKFAFATNKDITISSTPANKIMKNTNTEFKIKKTENQLTLEKAWTVTTLAQKAGISSCESSSKECTLPTTEGLKLYNSESDKTENGKINESDSSKKIKYEENVEGHNQGFKFYIDSSGQEITLSDNSKKIEKDNATYEIKEIGGQWYLAKKETTTGR